MEKVVHLFEIFKTIFLFNLFELRKAIFEAVENSNDLNQFGFEFELNLTRRHCSRGSLVSARPPLLGAVPCTRAPPARARRPRAGASHRPSRKAPLSPPIPLFDMDAAPDTPSPSPATRHADKRHHKCRPPLSFPPLFLFRKHATSTTSPPLASCPWPTVGSTLTPSEVKSSSPTAPFSEL
jgi:hypothetical protein